MASPRAITTLRRAGLLDPGLLLAGVGSLAWWGPSSASAYDAAALRFPRRRALIDDHGSLTYIALKRRTDLVATALRRGGLRHGDRVAVLCRNHRGFVEATIAAAKAGAKVVYANPAFAGPQLAEVLEREGVTWLLHDTDLPAAAEAGPGVTAVAVSPEHDPRWSFPDLARPRLPLLPPAVRAASAPVLLTSGTTGTPKGAQRAGGSVDAGAALGFLAAIPYRAGDTFVLPAPTFHAWGLSQLGVAAALGGTVVLRRRFDPARVWEDVVAHQAKVLAAVPTMLVRLLDAGPPAEHQLRVVASSGSALPGDLARRWMDAVGDTLYNLYGSTEVGQATIAGPADLRAAPGTAGRAIPGSTVLVLGPDDTPLPAGEGGRIFVGSGMAFSGYTGGGDKPRVGSLLGVGDLGYLDPDGRLFVTGREDDLIITGGENVHPSEIEDVLCANAAVAEAVVVGVLDPDLGQRLEALVVRRTGGRVSAAALQTEVGARLARFKVPRRIVFVDALPRNPAGKLLRPQAVDLLS